MGALSPQHVLYGQILPWSNQGIDHFPPCFLSFIEITTPTKFRRNSGHRKRNKLSHGFQLVSGIIQRNIKPKQPPTDMDFLSRAD